MDILTYKLIHFVGILLTFTSLGALAACASLAPDSKPGIKKASSALHGIGLLIIIVAGFGIVAKNPEIKGQEMWLMAKIGIWLFLGGAPVLMAKKPGLAVIWMLLSVAAGGASVYLALMKPF